MMAKGMILVAGALSAVIFAVYEVFSFAGLQFGWWAAPAFFGAPDVSVGGVSG
ncbi:MAG: hypothetical protein H0X28_14810 [Solirubrobacterales bacterium]|nr:hypothetical protein [Solirubrobacterales bacterium]